MSEADGRAKRRSRWWIGFVTIGVLVAAAVAVGAIWLTESQPTRWRATASAVVLPADHLRPVSIVNYYELLDGAQVVRTYAEILRLDRFRNAAASRLGISKDEREGIEFRVRVRPRTAVIILSSIAPNRRAAEGMIDELLREATSYTRRISREFEIEVIRQASGGAERASWWRPFYDWFEGRLG